MVTVVVVVVCEWLLLCVRERTFFNDFHFKCNNQKVHFQFSKHAPYIYFIMKIAKCQVLGVSLKGGETKIFSKQKICLSSICQAVIHVLIEIIVSVIG